MNCDWKTDKSWKLLFKPFQKGETQKEEKMIGKCLINLQDL